MLTSDEIENAECIIVAADKKVEMARFNGKKVIITKVANGIHKAEELIEKYGREENGLFIVSKLFSEKSLQSLKQIALMLINQKKLFLNIV